MSTAEAVRASRVRNGYRTDRARRRAETKAAAWVRENYPEVWRRIYNEQLVRVSEERRSVGAA